MYNEDEQYNRVNNEHANYWREAKDIKELTDNELIELGKVFAERLVTWATNPNYESWEFDSEELPWLLGGAEKVGLVRRRKSHTETVEKVIWDE